MNNNRKVYRINSIRTNFIYKNGSHQEEDVVYSRNAGCFVSICRGISIFIILLVFLFFLSFTIFFGTKYAYETKPNLTLDEFLNHRSFLIEKYAKIPKYIIPKQIHLVLHPKFTENITSSATFSLEPFTYSGYVYITVTSKKHNNKRIELNAKNLKIQASDVSVYRSVSLTNLDFDDDPDWNSKEIKYITVQRNKRDIEFNVIKQKDFNTSGEQDFDKPELDEINFKQYFYPILPPDDFVPIRVIDVEIDRSNDKVIIYLATEMKKDIYYIVKAKFYGNMTHDKGFYYTYYDDIDMNENDNNVSTKTKYFSATFLDPNNGRRLFPCFDDHIFRTPFDISISRTMSMTTESASNLEDTEEFDEELVVDEYNTTASMKASEVGFTISNMNPHMYHINENFSIIFYTRNLHFKNTKYSSTLFPRILNVYEQYFNQLYPHSVVKYVTVPNSDTSLCEIKNGMILSSELHIIIDKNYTTYSENYVKQQLSFELSQLYMYTFINYKTREHYWLHDALGNFFGIFALTQIGNNLQAEHRVLEDRLYAMREELNYKSTSLMFFNQNHLDDDGYHNFIKRKGSSILRMFNSTAGPTVLRDSLQKYFTKMKNQEYADFVESFNSTFESSRKLNHSEFIYKWTAFEKYPIVTVQRFDNNGSIVLKQIYHTEDEELNPKLLWNIPISYTNSTSKEFKFTSDFEYWLNDNFTIIYNAFSISDNDSWVLINSMGKGYYRVNYDQKNWEAIIKQLKTDHNVFPYETRAILIDDALNLARMNLLNYTIALDLLTYLMYKDENSLHPWLAALDNLNYLYKIMEELPNFSVIENLMRDIVNAVYEKINENAEKRQILRATTEDDEEKRLEYLIDENSCMLGFPPCLEDMKNKFENLLINDDEVDNQLLIKQNQSRNELFLLLCTTIKYSGFFEWNIVYKSFNDTNDLNYRKILLRSLGCSREISLINSYINFLVNKEYLWFSNDILHSLSENKIGMKYVMDYMYIHWRTVIQIFDIKQLSIIFMNISTENEYKVLQEIFLKYPETFRHRDKLVLRRVRDLIKSKLNWKNKIGRYI